MDIAHGVTMRMLDYVQSVIAAVPINKRQRDNVSEDDWKSLRQKVQDLFEKLNIPYQLSRRAKNLRENIHHSPDVEDFHFKAQIYWCNVRGKRYQIHEPEYLRKLFLPHSDILFELFGISGEQFVNEFVRIWHALSFGLESAYNSLEQFRQDILRETELKLEEQQAAEHIDFEQLMHDVIKEKRWEERRDEVFQLCFGTDLFDLEKITNLPNALLKDLSWSPGEEKEFFAAGEYAGWPLRIWPVFKRPFMRLEGRYYCFNLYILFDHIYRIMQRIILRKKPNYAETWNSIQRNVSETLPIEYLERILPGAKSLKEVYYRGITDRGTTGWCEVDGLLMYDDHLFVVESRAGAFTYTPPATDLPAWIASLRNLVQKPATQGARFVRYMKGADMVSLYNDRHESVAEIRRSDFRQVTVCAVTLDPFTEIAAQVQRLHKIGVDVGADPVWSISVDDLLVYADVFENPLIFLHFVEQRMRAFQSDELEVDDELDHFGLYLQYNHYSSYMEDIQETSRARLRFLGYRSDLDKFFTARLQDSSTACPLNQDMPFRINEIVDVLARTSKAGRARVASYLLDFDATWRDYIATGIEKELGRQITSGQPKPISMHGQMNLTMVCNMPSLRRIDTETILEHARTVTVLHQDNNRLLLILDYTHEHKLKKVDWYWLNATGISEGEKLRLSAKADQLRRSRVAKAKSDRKIGRNEQCPCGSGKKYKKCCLKL